METEGPVGVSKRSIPLFHKACVADLEIDELSICHDPVDVSVQTDESIDDTSSRINFHSIRNKPIIPTSRLFVKNLPIDIRCEQIEQVFQQFGIIQSINILQVCKHIPSDVDRSFRRGRATTIQSKEDIFEESPPNLEPADSNPLQQNDPESTMTYAYCWMESIEASKRAYEALDGIYCFDACPNPIQLVYVRTYSLGFGKELDDHDPSLATESKTDDKEDVSDEDGHSSQDDSEEERNESSPSQESHVKEDPGRANSSWDTQGISSSHAMFMDPPKPLAFQDDPLDTRRKLFVGQLPKDVDEFALVDLFCEFGALVDIKVLRARGVSRGCGFVRFTEPEEASAAVEELCGSKVFQNNKELPLNVRFADNIHEKTVRRHMKAEDKAKKMFGSAVVSPALLSKVSPPYIPGRPFLSADSSFSDPTVMSNTSAAAYATSMPMLRRTLSMGITTPATGAASGPPYPMMAFAPQAYPGMGMGLGGIPGLTLGVNSNGDSTTTNVAGVRSSHGVESSPEQQQPQLPTPPTPSPTPTRMSDDLNQGQSMESQGEAAITSHSFSSASYDQNTSQPFFAQGTHMAGHPQGMSPNTSMPLSFMGAAAASFAYQAANASQYSSPMHHPMYGYPQPTMGPIVHAGETGSNGSNHVQHQIVTAENRIGSQMNMMPGASSAIARHSGYRFVPVSIHGAVYYCPVPMDYEMSSGMNEYAQCVPRPEVSRSASAPNVQKAETSGSPSKTPVKSGAGQHPNVAMSPVTPMAMPPATRYVQGSVGASVPGFAGGYPSTNPSGMPYPAGLLNNASGPPYSYHVSGIAFDHSGNGRGSTPGAANFNSFMPTLPHAGSQPHYRYPAYGATGATGSNAGGMLMSGMNPMYYVGLGTQMQNPERYSRYPKASRRHNTSLGSGEGSRSVDAANNAEDVESRLTDKGVSGSSSTENQAAEKNTLAYDQPLHVMSEIRTGTGESSHDISGGGDGDGTTMANVAAAVHEMSPNNADSVLVAGKEQG